MNLLSRNSILAFVLLLVVAFTVFGVSLDHIKQWLGIEQIDQPGESPATYDQAANTAAESVSADIAVPMIKQQLELNEVRLLVANLRPEQQQQLLANPQAFASFIKQQLAQKSMLGLVKADALEKQPAIEFLMQRSAENALVEWYLKQLIEKNIPADFPQEEQIRAFYEENKATFVLGERVHLWQIFLPLEDSSSTEQILNLEAQANSIRDDIVRGVLSFAEAAAQYSKHSPSRENGGYVGLVNLSDLAPVMQDKITLLQENEISLPIKTESGIHIVRRGTVVGEQAVELQQIRSRIVDVLKKQAVENVRLSLLEKAEQQYPSNMTEQDIEEWRLKIRSGL